MFSRSFVVGLVIGILMGVVLGMVAVIVSGAEREPTTQQIFVPVTATPQPAVSPTPDLRPRARVAVTVRSGPSDDYVTLGVINRGAILQPIGRDGGGEWLAVRYPAGSASTGWVPAGDVEGVEETESLTVLQPTPLPLAGPPPASGFVPQGVPATPATPGVPAASPTAVQQLPDLVVADVSLLADGRVSARIGNIGGTLQQGVIFVRFGNAIGELDLVQVPQTLFPAGAVITVNSSLRAVPGQTVRVVVNPGGDIREASTANNTREVTFPVSDSPS